MPRTADRGAALTLDGFLQESLAVLVAAVVVVFASGRLKIPPVAGLLLTGLLIGPSGLSLIADRARVEVFAEIGVVLLLFAIGLELSLEELKELGRPFFVGGLAQTLLTVAATMTVAAALGLSTRQALFAGFVVALSSTAVVLKLYETRREADTPQGRVVLGVLLFQDFLIVPLIVLTPVLAGSVTASAAQLALRFGGALALVTAVFALARFVMPRVLHQLAASRVRELFVLGALAICLAMAWFTHALGFSLALGAFLAGILVSETEYGHQMIADIGPFRDLFASIFFISIGMLVNLRFAAERAPELVGLAVLLVLLKAGVAALAVRLAGYPIRVAVIAGLGLAQIGEFSFVLMEVGRAHGLLAEDRFQVLLVAAVLTLVATPFLIQAAPALGRFFAGLRRARPEPAVVASAEEMSQHVVVVGYGVHGSTLAGVLAEAHIPYLVVELDPHRVRLARTRGAPVMFGDATRGEILDRAGVERAKVVVFAFSDPAVMRRAVLHARERNSAARIVVRTRAVREIEALTRSGADEVVAEEFESSIELFTRVLAQFHVPRHVIRAATRALRGERYQMLRTPRRGKVISAAVLEALEAEATEIYRVAAASLAVGRTLRELDLRRGTGASVIAVVRGETSFANPSADLALAAGDSLVLVGSHEQVDRALEFLARAAP